MEKKWWHDKVIYQVYPKSFNDSNGDGIGDLPGIIEKLDYLAELGIDIIWLSPVYSSPMEDNGYDIADYYAIGEQFGTMADMDKLIAEAKKRDIGIMMDLVINHSSDQHQWFKESKKSKDNPKRDWYIWKDPAENGGPPTNWRSVFGGSAWTFDQQTEQYYLHTFAEEQPDLNWENQELRQELYKMVNWWLDKGLAGFRVDAISFIKKGEYKNLTPDGEDGLAEIHSLTANKEGILAYLNELNQETFSNYKIVTVAEIYPDKSERMKEFVGEGGPFDFIFDFRHTDLVMRPDSNWMREKEWNLMKLKKIFNQIQQTYDEDSRVALFLENHDQPRCLNKYLAEENINRYSAKMLAAVFMLMRGVPFIYQGQEIGMTNVKYESIEDYNDAASIGKYKMALENGHQEDEVLKAVWNRSRDNSRTPMQWDDSKNAGFSSAEPWLKVNSNYKDINVKNVLADPDSLYYFYQDLIRLRKESGYSKNLIDGKYEEILEKNQDFMAYLRIKDDKKIMVIANFRDENIELELNYKLKKLILSNYPDSKERLKSDRDKIKYNFRPFETLVLEVE
ncbi:glycoside hydrolase family 13 protein [Halanaerobium kushneri]|uniref:Oligo-1,6-glucosidase/alpha-glucosidase n=1 Tax=Halanaerobium kushneri TaxID=56779 RepID=A0A1N6WNH4_9FIRM|nr:alpha-glucosidase [Halanaerobium kushneri]SIQ91552.1 oligo-1,6-glucosidase/alpha-glucosidase [Halanaerobium kushneri]